MNVRSEQPDQVSEKGTGTAEAVPEPVLFLCRSPLQAMMIEKICVKEGIGRIDVIYYNRRHSPKNDIYFSRLSRLAGKAVLFYGFSLFGFLKVARMIARRHRSIFIADINHGLFRLIISLKRGSRLYTFDDGVGNFNREGKLHIDTRTRLQRLRDSLLMLPIPGRISERSIIHYTIDRHFENIVPPNRLREIPFRLEGHRSPSKGQVHILIGHPADAYPRDQYALLLKAFRAVPDAFYVPHPIENLAEISQDVRVLNDNRILEDIILSFLAEGMSVRLIGAPSTIFSTITDERVEKYCLRVSDISIFPDLLARLGCEVCDVTDRKGLSDWRSRVQGWKS